MVLEKLSTTKEGLNVIFHVFRYIILIKILQEATNIRIRKYNNDNHKYNDGEEGWNKFPAIIVAIVIGVIVAHTIYFVSFHIYKLLPCSFYHKVL